MRTSTLLTAGVALIGIGQSAAVEKRDLLQDLQARAIEALKAAESKNIGTKRADCTLDNASVRKDWYTQHCPPSILHLTSPQGKNDSNPAQVLHQRRPMHVQRARKIRPSASPRRKDALRRLCRPAHQPDTNDPSDRKLLELA